MTSKASLSKILSLLQQARDLMHQASVIAEGDDCKGLQDMYPLSSDIANDGNGIEDTMKYVRRLLSYEEIR